jgi:dTDP-4-dehydrorhamnose reductase
MNMTVSSPETSPRPRLLIVGGNSYVGGACHQALGDAFEIRTTTRQGSNGSLALDLAQPEKFAYASLSPADTVLFCAAISSPDVCGNNPALAHQVNVAGPAYFFRQAGQQGARLIFLSSDTVVGPAEAPADETVAPRPHGKYACLKRELEDLLLAGSTAKILRLSLVVSLQDKFTSYLRKCLRENQPPSLLHPLYRNAVHVSDIAAVTARLATGWSSYPARVIHAAGPRCISRVGLAEQFFEAVGYDGRYTVQLPDPEFYAQRPERIALRSLHFAGILGRDPCSIAAGYRMELTKNRILSPENL